MRNSVIEYFHMGELHCKPINKKVAIFDLDGTLIVYNKHQKMSKDVDWIPLYDNTVSKLTSISNSGYQIAIVSNQGGLRNFRSRFLSKLKKFLAHFDFPIFFIAALGDDDFRKPLTQAITRIKMHLKCKEFDSESYYVGDAAGRRGNVATNMASDHSCCDIKFAYNCGLKFYLPENIFCGVKETPSLVLYDPQLYATDIKSPFATKDIVILIGNGKLSGKSFFADKYLKYYQKIRNISPTQTKCCYIDVQTIYELSKIIEKHGSTNVEVVYLDYSYQTLHFLKMIGKFSGRRSLFKFRSSEIHKLAKAAREGGFLQILIYQIPIKYVHFRFDNTKYSALQLRLSQEQL